MRWVIGDVHGMLAPLRALLAGIRARDPKPTLFFVGDYVNRGPDSRGVIDLLLSLDDEFPGRARFVRGNHDDVFDLVINAQAYTGQTSDGHRIAAFQWFMQHGLDATFLSYGADELFLLDVLRRPSLASLDELIDLVPGEHRRFIRDLPPTIEEPDLFVAHAKWDPDTPADAIASRAGSSDKTRYTLLWGRFTADEIERKKRWRGRRGFFGHTPVENYASDDADELLPIVRDDIVLLDTAAALSATGRLTAACADSGEILQADRAGGIIAGAEGE